jgi:hypothetical protein
MSGFFLLVRGVGMGGTGVAASGETVIGINTFGDAGAIQVETLASITGLTAWVDYIPVYVVTDTQKPWRTDDDGFIPLVEP